MVRSKKELKREEARANKKENRKRIHLQCSAELESLAAYSAPSLYWTECGLVGVTSHIYPMRSMLRSSGVKNNPIRAEGLGRKSREALVGGSSGVVVPIP